MFIVHWLITVLSYVLFLALILIIVLIILASIVLNNTFSITQ